MFSNVFWPVAGRMARRQRGLVAQANSVLSNGQPLSAARHSAGDWPEYV